jgi:hypothetical protein
MHVTWWRGIDKACRLIDFCQQAALHLAKLVKSQLRRRGVVETSACDYPAQTTGLVTALAEHVKVASVPRHGEPSALEASSAGFQLERTIVQISLGALTMQQAGYSARAFTSTAAICHFLTRPSGSPNKHVHCLQWIMCTQHAGAASPGPHRLHSLSLSTAETGCKVGEIRLEHDRGPRM